MQFSPPKPGAQQTKNLTTTVNRRGLVREFDMKKGAWNIIITSHSSMLLLVSLPICQILELRNKIYRFTSRTPSFFPQVNYHCVIKKYLQLTVKKDWHLKVSILLWNIFLWYSPPDLRVCVIGNWSLHTCKLSFSPNARCKRTQQLPTLLANNTHQHKQN